MIHFHFLMKGAACLAGMPSHYRANISRADLSGLPFAHPTIHPSCARDGFRLAWVFLLPLFGILLCAAFVSAPPLLRPGLGLLGILWLAILLLLKRTVILGVFCALLGFATLCVVSVFPAPFDVVGLDLLSVGLAPLALVFAVALGIALGPLGDPRASRRDGGAVLVHSFVPLLSVFSGARFAGAVNNAPFRDMPASTRGAGKKGGQPALARLISCYLFHGSPSVPNQRALCKNYSVV